MAEHPSGSTKAADNLVDRFLHDKIDSVPHLEALMLLWNSRPVWWTPPELASRLYLPPDTVRSVLRDLVRLRLVAEEGQHQRFSYNSGSEDRDRTMHLVDDAHRHDLVRISTMLHSKASSSIREFARAFRIKKEHEE